MSDVFGFNENDAKQLVGGLSTGKPSRAENHFEQQIDDRRIEVVYSAGGVTARSGTTMGTGTGVVQQINSSGVLSDWTKPSGGTLTITFKSLSTKAGCAGYYLVNRNNVSGVWLTQGDPIVDVYLDGLSLKQRRSTDCTETIFTGTECA